MIPDGGVEACDARTRQFDAALYALADEVQRAGRPRPATLGRALDAAQAAPEAAAASPHSRYHRNGFYKVVLGSTPAGIVRLHLWDDLRPPEGALDIHNHVSPMRSAVLAGVLSEKAFRPDRCGPVRRRHFRFPSWTTVDRRPERVDDCSLAPTGAREHPVGDVYDITETTLHITVPNADAGPTLTLVVQQPPTIAWTDVYTRRHAVLTQDNEPSLSSGEVQLVLARSRELAGL